MSEIGFWERVECFSLTFNAKVLFDFPPLTLKMAHCYLDARLDLLWLSVHQACGRLAKGSKRAEGHSSETYPVRP